MKILFVASSLASGGAERVLSVLANELARRGYEVGILTICKEDIFYTLDLNIKVIELDLCGNSKNIFESIARGYQIIKSLHVNFKNIAPDVIITFMGKVNVYALLANYTNRYKIIATEHIDNYICPTSKIVDILRKKTYKNAKALVSVSKGASEYFNFLDSRKRHVIYNPLEQEILEKSCKSVENLPDRYIIAVGRLADQKNYASMIEAFSSLEAKKVQLLIFGDGALKDEIQRHIESKNLQDKIKLMGVVKNIYPYMKNAKFLTLSSKYEGFGNVLIEAMACGCPVVSFDCPSGPSEIITDGVNGILVENQNIDKLAIAMQTLIDNTNLREKMSKKAKEVYEIYNIEKIANQWEQLICQVAQEK